MLLHKLELECGLQTNLWLHLPRALRSESSDLGADFADITIAVEVGDVASVTFFG